VLPSLCQSVRVDDVYTAGSGKTVSIYAVMYEYSNIIVRTNSIVITSRLRSRHQV
jgi:hypothetical protein